MKKFILFVLTAIFLALTSCGPEPEIITCFDPQYTLWHVEVLNESADSYSFSFEPVCKLSQTICEMDGLNVTFQVDGEDEAFLHSTYLDESLPCTLFELPTLVVTIDQNGDVSFSF